MRSIKHHENGKSGLAILGHSPKKLRKQLVDESEYLQKIKKEIEADKQKEKDNKALKAIE
mgnify:CR=1 FL=1